MSLDLRRQAEPTRVSYIVAEGSAAAVATLDAPERWHGCVLALVGPSGSGKTHLAIDWARRQKAAVFDPAKPPAPQLARSQGQAVLWDDADRAVGQDETLFHLINRAASGERLLLLTGKRPPRDWATALPDLRSRLNALSVAQLAEPDDAVLAALLRKLFAERNIRPADDLLPYLLRRMERSASAAQALVASLDAVAGEEGRAVTRALARRVLEPLAEDEP